MNWLGIVITLVTALLGGGGIAAVLNAYYNSKRNSAQSETEARAQWTNEFNAVIAAQDIQFLRLDKELTELRGQVRDLRRESRSAEDYIDILIVGISNGSIPPIPPRI